MSSILLCRHGETSANVAGIMQGQSESELTALGRAQAQDLACEICRRASEAGAPFATSVYSSDLSRASATAAFVVAALQERCSGSTFTLATDPRLRERRLGPLQGRTPEASRSLYPRTWDAVFGSGADGTASGLTEPGADENGGLESAAEVRERAAAALREIAANHPGQRIVLVSHGGCIFSAVAEVTKCRKNAVPHIGNASITTLVAPAQGKAEPWQLVSPAGDDRHVTAGKGGAVNVDVSAK